MKKKGVILSFLFISFLIIQLGGISVSGGLTEQKTQKFKPVPRVPIILDCNINLPDSRGVPGVKVVLYEVLRSGVLRSVKSGETNEKGLCQIKVGREFMNKKVKFIPKYGDFPPGRYFRPSPSEFRITDMHHSVFYTYSGPLPDLEGAAASIELHGEERTSREGLLKVRINNNGLASAGFFRVKARYWVRKAGFLSSFEERTVKIDFYGIPGRNSRIEEVDLTVSERNRYLTDHILSVQVDLDDSVFESDESNNWYRPPIR